MGEMDVCAFVKDAQPVPSLAEVEAAIAMCIVRLNILTAIREKLRLPNGHTLDIITEDMDIRTKKGIWRTIARKKGIDRPTYEQIRETGKKATIDDLLALSGADLLATSNFGHGSLRKLKDTLAAKGLFLAGD